MRFRVGSAGQHARGDSTARWELRTLLLSYTMAMAVYMKPHTPAVLIQCKELRFL